MAAPTTSANFLDLVRLAGVVDEKRLDAFLERGESSGLPESPHQLADLLVEAGLLTGYQAVQILKGKLDFFRIGPYVVLERLGFGATSNVYLCEDIRTQDRVAIKVLTVLKAQDEVALKRFYREARAASHLDHPNIVRVRDVDHDADTHYMVMDFVDGSSVQDIVQHFGPMDVTRAAHYVRQAAQGLQYAHQAGLVHRDIKPGNLLVDREGTIKILDMGVARFAQEEGDVLTRGVVLGAPEYLPPEQAVDSHNVDIRADIYSLGATFYFMLAGEPPYAEEKTLAQKFLSKASRPPRPIQELRPEVPDELLPILDKMLARDPAERYPTPAAVADALAPFTKSPLGPPADQEMPKLSPAARAKKLVERAKPPPAPPPPMLAPARDVWSSTREECAGVRAFLQPPPAPAPPPKRHPPPSEKRATVRSPRHQEEAAEDEAALLETPTRARRRKVRGHRRSQSFSQVVQILVFLAVLAATFAVAWVLFLQRK
jgi:serine/threonine protein kinase